MTFLPDRKKILISHRHFWPETTPFASILKILADDLNQAHHIEVLSTKPTYREVDGFESKLSMDSYHVSRIFALKNEKSSVFIRIFNMVYYTIRLTLRMLVARYDVVIVSTFPPIVVPFLVSIICRLKRIKFIYYVQDIYPEMALMVSNSWLKSKLWSCIAVLDNYTLSNCWKIVTLSSDMKHTLVRRLDGLKEDNIHVVDNPGLTGVYSEHRPSSPRIYPKQGDLIRLIYSGNIGYFQDIDKIKILSQLVASHTKLELLFCGDGVFYQRLETELDQYSNIKFLGFLPSRRLSEVFETCHFGVVSLRDGLHRYANPSKIGTYLRNGLPVVSLMEQSSEISRQLTEDRMGVTVDVYKTCNIYQTLQEFLAQFNAVHFSEQTLLLSSESRFLVEWNRILQQV